MSATLGSSAAGLLVEIHTAARRYLVPLAHLDGLTLVAAGAAVSNEATAQVSVWRELGPLLDATDVGPHGRRHALTVTLRRRSVALLVERVADFGSPGTLQPLAPLLVSRLARPWLLGAVVVANEPVLVLDLRRIAVDVALGAAGVAGAMPAKK